MVKVALNFICKNECQVIRTMLESAAPVVDLVVASDTGSSDGTQDIIKEFGSAHNLPTYVYDNGFEDFSSARNEGMEALRRTVKLLQWNPVEVFVLWLDCDDKLVLKKGFSRDDIKGDIHYIPGVFQNSGYVRGQFLRLSKRFYWYGPVHEELRCRDAKVREGKLKGISIFSDKTGSSWQGDLLRKNENYARVLEKFITTRDRAVRWVFMTAQSYHAAAEYGDDLALTEELYDKAMGYYKEVAGERKTDPEMAWFAYWSIANILEAIKSPWEKVEEALIQAWKMDVVRGEPHKRRIAHYMDMGEWDAAYGLSSFAKEKFFGKNPYPARTRFVDVDFYQWRVVLLHGQICFQVGKTAEGVACYDSLMELARVHREYFSAETLAEVEGLKGVMEGI